METLRFLTDESLPVCTFCKKEIQVSEPYRVIKDGPFHDGFTPDSDCLGKWYQERYGQLQVQTQLQLLSVERR